MPHEGLKYLAVPTKYCTHRASQWTVPPAHSLSRDSARRTRSKGRHGPRRGPASQPNSSTGFTVHTHRAAVLLVLGTGVLKSLIFAPIGIWPVSFICLVPWLVLVGASHHARRVYVYSFLLGWAFFLVNMRWNLACLI